MAAAKKQLIIKQTSTKKSSHGIKMVVVFTISEQLLQTNTQNFSAHNSSAYQNIDMQNCQFRTFYVFLFSFL